MKLHRLTFAFVPVLLSGCTWLADMESARAARAQSPTPAAPTASTAAASPSALASAPHAGPAPSATGAARAPDPLRVRLDAAVRLADEAVAVEGSEAAAKFTNEDIRRCSFGVDDCLALVREVAGSTKETIPERLVVLAAATKTVARSLRPPLSRSHALSMESRVQVAELAAAKSRELADQLVVERDRIKKELAAAEAEKGELDPVRGECAKDAAACKAKCDAGTALHCVARAEQLFEAKKDPEARTAAQAGCAKNVRAGCLLVEMIDDQAKKRSAELDGSWRDVEEVGDDVARKYHQAEMLSKLANNPRLQRQLQQMRVITAATVKEKFCPAKKEFVKAGGAAEFAKRATAHCKDDPPEAAGMSGAQLKLTAQCQTAFTQSCP